MLIGQGTSAKKAGCPILVIIFARLADGRSMRLLLTVGVEALLLL